MYILKFEEERYILTDEEFEELYRWYERGFEPARDYREFVRPIWQREAPHIPLSSFMARLRAIIEPEARRILRERGIEVEFEYKPEVRMFRVQYAVLYYATEETKKTPNPFMEARAWAIVPEEEVKKYRKIVEREAWYIPMLIGSIYDAWYKGSIAEVEGNREIVAVRGGYEEREVEEKRIGLQRGVAFYRIYSTGAMDTWENPARFFDESLIRKFEELLFPAVLEYEGFESEDEFKNEVANLHKKAVELLEKGRYEDALKRIGTIQKWMAECDVLYAPVRWM